MYHIQTLTQDRTWLSAPVTYISFYVLKDNYHFANPLKTLKDLYSRSAGCLQVISGDAKNPPRRDVQGWMSDGKSVVIGLSGWDSPETLQAALKDSAIVKATKEVEAMAVHTESCPVQFTVVEKSRYEHKWRRLPEPYLKDIPISEK